MPKPSLVDLAIEARAREQCEDDFFFRSPKGPQKVRSICTKCLKEEVETVRGRVCKTCRKATADHYNKVSPSRVSRSLLKRYMKGEL